MNEQRKWFTKKRYLISAGVIGVVIAINAMNLKAPQQATQDTYQPQVQGQSIIVPDKTKEVSPVPAPQTVDPVVPEVTPPPAVKPTPPSPKPTPVPIPTGSTYKNVDGDTIPSPQYHETAPAGASAKCNDGTYSFSAHRSGTCSHHGGVSKWL